MYLYVVTALFKPNEYVSTCHSHFVGVYNEIDFAKEGILEYCKKQAIEITNVDIHFRYADCNVLKITSDYDFYSFEINRCLLNNDKAMLYAPGSLIYNSCQEKVNRISKLN